MPNGSLSQVVEMVVVETKATAVPEVVEVLVEY
jgi:hypothetical protein